MADVFLDSNGWLASGMPVPGAALAATTAQGASASTGGGFEAVFQRMWGGQEVTDARAGEPMALLTTPITHAVPTPSIATPDGLASSFVSGRVVEPGVQWRRPPLRSDVDAVGDAGSVSADAAVRLGVDGADAEAVVSDDLVVPTDSVPLGFNSEPLPLMAGVPMSQMPPVVDAGTGLAAVEGLRLPLKAASKKDLAASAPVSEQELPSTPELTGAPPSAPLPFSAPQAAPEAQVSDAGFTRIQEPIFVQDRAQGMASLALGQAMEPASLMAGVPMSQMPPVVDAGTGLAAVESFRLPLKAASKKDLAASAPVSEQELPSTPELAGAPLPFAAPQPATETPPTTGDQPAPMVGVSALVPVDVERPFVAAMFNGSAQDWEMVRTTALLLHLRPDDPMVGAPFKGDAPGLLPVRTEPLLLPVASAWWPLRSETTPSTPWAATVEGARDSSTGMNPADSAAVEGLDLEGMWRDARLSAQPLSNAAPSPADLLLSMPELDDAVEALLSPSDTGQMPSGAMPAVALPPPRSPELGTLLTLASQWSAGSVKTHEAYVEMTERMSHWIGQRLGVHFQQGQWDVRFVLTPESLGTIDVEMSMRSGELTLSLQASHPMTRDLLSEGVARLRESMAQLGIDVAGLHLGGEAGTRHGGNSTSHSPATASGPLVSEEPPPLTVPAAVPSAGAEGCDVLV